MRSFFISKRYAFKCDPGRIVQVKLEDTVQLQTLLALYDQETVRNNGQTSDLRSKTFVKLHLDQMMRTPTSESRTKLWNGDQLPRVQRERKPTFRGKRECFQWKAHGHTSPWKQWQRSQTRRSSSPTSHSKAKQTDDEEQKSSQGSGNTQENSSDKSKIPCRFKFCKNPSCRFWHPPVCLNYKSETKVVYMATNAISDMLRQTGKPSKKSKKGGSKGSVAFLKESTHLRLCISRFLSENVYST